MKAEGMLAKHAFDIRTLRCSCFLAAWAKTDQKQTTTTTTTTTTAPHQPIQHC